MDLFDQVSEDIKNAMKAKDKVADVYKRQHLNGVTDEEIKKGMASFRGVDRRFDFKIKNDRVVFPVSYTHLDVYKRQLW